MTDQGDEQRPIKSGESFTLTRTETVVGHEDDMITDSNGITWVFRNGEWRDVRDLAGDQHG